MSRHRNPREGEIVKARGMRIPFSFWPETFVAGDRIQTLDPWRCIQLHVCQRSMSGPKLNQALAFLDQAEDFHRAASDRRTASKPLLHYYSFLALAKAYLVIKKGMDLDRCHHGLSDPSSNIRKRLNLKSQSVKVAEDNPKTKIIPIYRNFIEQSGFHVPVQPKPVKVVDLLDQAVGIAGVADRSMAKSPHFYPIEDIGYHYNSSNKEVWISFKISKDRLAASSNSARLLQANSKSFEEVASDDDRYRRYESCSVATYTKSPLDALNGLVRHVWHDIWSEMIPGQFKFWVSTLPVKNRLSQLAAGYQAMFYFGSVTRYRPYDFRKIANGQYGWMVQEFLNTQPMQFIYFLGSGMIDAEMVVPLLGAK